mgnify:CR=1 FL=1
MNDTIIETKYGIAKGEFVFENVPLSIGQNIIKANITSGSLQKTSNAVPVLRKPVSNITLTVSYSESGGAQKTNHLVYSSEGNIKVGLATENPSPDITETGPISILNTNPTKDSTYIFVTPSSAKPEERETELAKYTFLEEEHPFFFTKKYSVSPEYIISTALNYENILIHGLQKVSAGNHILVIENLGVSDGKTVVKIEIR